MCKFKWKKTVSLYLALIILTIPLLSQVDQKEMLEAKMQAEMDAKRDVNKAIWFIVGCAGSIIGLLVAQVITASPPQATLLGKSPEYVAAYSDTYVIKMKKLRTTWSLYGCGVSVALWGVAILVLFAAEEELVSSYYY